MKEAIINCQNYKYIIPFVSDSVIKERESDDVFNALLKTNYGII